MRFLLILLLFSSCISNEEKYLIIGDTKYEITKANDSCEYYAIKMTSGKNYYHYQQCSWCKKHKN